MSDESIHDDLTAPIEGDLELKRAPVRAQQNGVIKVFDLVEMDGLRHTQWMEKFRTRQKDQPITVDPETGKPKVSVDKISFGGMEDDLISLCLQYRGIWDGERIIEQPDEDTVPTVQPGEFYPVDRLQSWPSSFRQQLWDRVRKMNGLDRESRARAKNS